MSGSTATSSTVKPSFKRIDFKPSSGDSGLPGSTGDSAARADAVAQTRRSARTKGARRIDHQPTRVNRATEAIPAARATCPAFCSSWNDITAGVGPAASLARVENPFDVPLRARYG